MIKKIMMLVLTMVVGLSLTGNAEATSKAGVSVNTTKSNYTASDGYVTLAIKNDNNYNVGVEIQPQIKSNGKWNDLDWYDVEFVNKGKKVYNKTSIKEFKTGEYRYQITINTYDKDGYVKDSKKVNNSNFKVKR